MAACAAPWAPPSGLGLALGEDCVTLRAGLTVLTGPCLPLPVVSLPKSLAMPVRLSTPQLYPYLGKLSYLQ